MSILLKQFFVGTAQRPAGTDAQGVVLVNQMRAL